MEVVLIDFAMVLILSVFRIADQSAADVHNRAVLSSAVPRRVRTFIVCPEDRSRPSDGQEK